MTCDLTTNCFSSFFGSAAHGMKVEWTSAQSENLGTSDIQIKMTSYLKAYLHVYTDEDTGTSTTKTDQYTANGYEWVSYSSVASSSNTVYDAENFDLQFYLAWKNPDTSSSLTYDGIQARTISTMTTSVDGSARPTMEILWDRSGDAIFDIKPSTTYNTADTEWDDAADDNVELVTPADATTDLCTEVWYLSDSDFACVEMEGTIKRARNTGDTTSDIILEYGSYDIHALIGSKTTSDAQSDESLRLGEQTIDFSVLA